MGTKFLEGFPGKSLGENICKHILSGHIIEFDFIVFNLLAYKMMPNVNVFGSRVRYWVVCKCNAP